MEDARFRLGPVRVAPWLGLRDASYIRSFVSAAGEEVPSGFTVTVGGGLRTYLRTGPKVIWTAHVLPEYTWWSSDSDRNRVNGRYGAEVHAFFNRLTVGAMATRNQEQQIVTPEVPEPVSSRAENGQLLVELQMTGALSLFSESRISRVRNLVEEDADLLVPADRLDLLDREEAVTRAGVRWRPRESWLIGLGAEVSRVDFERDALDRSNEGTAPVLELMVDRPKLFVQLDLAQRSLEARRGSSFVAFDELTGMAAVSLRPRRRTSYWVYGNRNLVYSVDPTAAYLLDERIGVSISAELGSRMASRIFLETGSNDYVSLIGSAPRQDDLIAWGGSMRFRLRGRVSLEILGVRTEFESDLPGGDRSYTALGTRINLVGSR